MVFGLGRKKKKKTKEEAEKDNEKADKDDEKTPEEVIPWNLETGQGNATWKTSRWLLPPLPDGKRWHHCAVVLCDGSVLVAGGRVNGEVSDSVWILDAAFSTELKWKVGPSMIEKRSGFAMVLCGSKLYAIGGHNGGNTSLNTIECLDVSRGIRGLTFEYASAALWAFPNQRRLPRDLYRKAAESAPTQWSTLSCQLFHPRSGCAAVAVMDRYIVVMGGYGGFLDANTVEIITDAARVRYTVEILDTHTNTVTSPPNTGMTSSRHLFGAAVVGQTLYAVGGGYGPACSKVECCDIHELIGAPTTTHLALKSAFKWKEVDSLSLLEGRRGFGLVAVGSCLIAVGGEGENGLVQSVEVVDTQKRKVWKLPDMGQARKLCTAVAQNGRVVVLGGWAGVLAGRGLDSVEMIQLTQPPKQQMNHHVHVKTEEEQCQNTLGQVKPQARPMAGVSQETMLTPLGPPTKSKLSAPQGGLVEQNKATSVWHTPTDIPRLPDGTRFYHAYVELPDGSLVIAGGYVNGVCSNSVWFLDMSSSTWRPGPSMNETRYSFALVLCANTLYAIGGWRGGGARLNAVDTVESLDVSLFCGTHSLLFNKYVADASPEQIPFSWTSLACKLSSPREGCAAAWTRWLYFVK